MRAISLAAATALAALAVPASAFPNWTAPPAVSGPVGPPLVGIGPPPFSREFNVIHRPGRHDGERDGRFHRRGFGGVLLGHSGWSIRERQTEDWWHDNPQRSFPRWVTSGRCDRQWYAGDTLRC